MRDEAARLVGALEWITRLPFCGDRELGGLLGVDEQDARSLIHQLRKQGWLESFAAGSPELEPRRLAVLRDGVVPALASACRRDRASIEGSLPVRLRDSLERAARIEITVGVNSLIAGLASDLRRSRTAALVDARSLPLALPRPERWWLPGTEGYGCLRAGSLHAPFLLVWDRAAAPDLHRRRRLASWFAASVRVGARWGREGLPPILVRCPSARELRVWEEALERQLEGDSERLDLLFVTDEELYRAGAGGALWTRPGRTPAPLAEQLGWGAEPVVRTIRIDGMLADLQPPARRGGASLRRPPAAQRKPDWSGPSWHRVGSLALSTGPAEQTALEWVARHPLMSAAELTALLNEPERVVRRRLEWLTDAGTIVADGVTDEPRYLLTWLGMRWLAGRSGVPAAIFGRHGWVTFDRGHRSGPQRPVRHRDHTLGLNRFAAQLAVDARGSGWWLREWRNEAESTHRFVVEDGRPSWIRPDGSGVLVRGAEARSFFLEYDRGTLDGGDYHAKFEGYRRYYAGTSWAEQFPYAPALLFVCSDGRAEARVRQAATAAGPAEMYTTSEWRFGDRTAAGTGLFGPIWQPITTTGGGPPALVTNTVAAHCQSADRLLAQGGTDLGERTRHAHRCRSGDPATYRTQSRVPTGRPG